MLFKKRSTRNVQAAAATKAAVGPRDKPISATNSIASDSTSVVDIYLEDDEEWKSRAKENNQGSTKAKDMTGLEEDDALSCSIGLPKLDPGRSHSRCRADNRKIILPEPKSMQKNVKPSSLLLQNSSRTSTTSEEQFTALNDNNDNNNSDSSETMVVHSTKTDYVSSKPSLLLIKDIDKQNAAVDFWYSVVTQQTKLYGQKDHRTAQSMIELGMVYVQCEVSIHVCKFEGLIHCK